jgi:hypothetical protein
MGTKKQELIDGCFAKAADDEPLFVLRATDEIAPQIVRWWAREAELAGTPREKVMEAHQLADAMLAWQESHGAKVPD